MTTDYRKGKAGVILSVFHGLGFRDPVTGEMVVYDKPLHPSLHPLSNDDCTLYMAQTWPKFGLFRPLVYEILSIDSGTAPNWIDVQNRQLIIDRCRSVYRCSYELVNQVREENTAVLRCAA